MFKKLLLSLALVCAIALPAQAALTPTFTLSQNIFGPPGGQRSVTGYFTLGASDTYVTGGFTVTPSVFGFAQNITQITFGPPNGPFLPYFTSSAGGGTIKFNTLNPTSAAAIVSGASNIAATATTATVSGLSGLTANTPIFCQLDDAATAGGGTGTWATTAAVASCKYASATSFTITSTAAAPTNGGNFTYWIGTAPSITNTAAFAELANATSVASQVVPFIATGY